ncbi:ferritin-like domain-containing protein [Paenarthrobacter sp. NPDC089675]|uniref:ferritin-like domain-containing protein n=1 Tax=Paenarthrobacter sp. NPDC089675 TaxID=3364376 RepID=UPI0038264C35
MLVAIVALLVAGTGIVLVPRNSAEPEAVPFSENARLAAYGDALALRDSAASLGGSPDSGTASTELADAVTLLTTHAQALLGPDPSTSDSPTIGDRDTRKPTSAGDVVEAIAASGRQRLSDAGEADGGIARLLAAVGTSQLLEAERLAGLFKVQLPSREPADKASATKTAGDQTRSTAQCPSASPTPRPTDATTDTALAAGVRSEQEAVYAYQVALKRLDATAAVTAAKGLAAHELLLQQAESLTRLNCGDVPAREAGYRLAPGFPQDPPAHLGALETGALPVFGDLVALSDGQTRQWAIDSLLAAARRGLGWGASLPALPGLKLDAGGLPPLPASPAGRG